MALLILTPLLGIGGTALVSFIKGFSFQAVILNTFVSASVCIIAEIPLAGAEPDKNGAPYLMVSYISGLLLAFLSSFVYECILPIAAPSAVIALILGEGAGVSALILFASISTVLLYESGLYFFYIFLTGFILIILFCSRKRYRVFPIILTYVSLGGILYISCLFMSRAELNPIMIISPFVGAFLNLLILMIVRPKVIENVLDRRELFIKSILDPEYDLLMKLKNTDRDEYDRAIHSAHLSDILAERLGANRRKTVSISYYSRIGVLRGDKENIDIKSLALIREREFPTFISEGIKEYYSINGKRQSKESSLVLIVNNLLSDIYSYFETHGGKSPDYQEIVINCMKRMIADNRIKLSDLSLYDLGVISEVLKDKVIYYECILRK